MILLLALTIAIAIALVTRPGRAAASKRLRLTRIVPVLDAVCLVSLIAIPVLAALTIVDFRGSDSKGRTREDRKQVVELANTGPGDACRNSRDPDCGPFRWDPAPGPNAPVEIVITYSPSSPRVGEQVTVTVHVSDADALIGDVTMAFGDEAAAMIPPQSIVNCVGAATGPWSLPGATPDDVVKTFRHTYSRAADLTLDAYAASPEIVSGTCPPNPYASQGTASVPIRISER
ncbi:MAG: hypothetical protein E6G06_08580 [Actinobacteria bacterium]|nr:MAG: hypothetical protein E6G06_08580 [Actinomycetota bacterium]